MLDTKDLKVPLKNNERRVSDDIFPCKMKGFETPVLFLVFNRPDTTAKVLMKIRQIKPKHLYVAADGPRMNNSSDIKKCNEVLCIIETAIDWECDVHKLYRETNLGCGLAVSSAIDWFFQQVEFGIILEDDTLPDESFFNYCQDLLHFYKDDSRVMHISGNNYSHSLLKNSNYYFTSLPFNWGWATWRRAWNKYDYNYKDTAPEEKLKILQKAFTNEKIINYWHNRLSDFHLKPKSYTWDYQWFLSIWNNKGLVIQPEKNLVQNIGFGPEGSHTVDVNHYLTSVTAEKIGHIKYTKLFDIDDKLQNENFDFYFGNNEKKSVALILKKHAGLNFLKIGGRKIFAKVLIKLFPELSYLKSRHMSWYSIQSTSDNSQVGEKTRLYDPSHIYDTTIGEYSYIASNATIYNTDIGKFCSIGPNLLCGYGIHPIDGLSTSPMFYSTEKQNGLTLSLSNKIVERKRIKIGNDVFVGANVTILDGVIIGDGVVIGAGSVVSKDIPSYAIAVGTPIKIIRYRFEEIQIEKLLKIRWWDFDDKDLFEVEKYFFKVDEFINKYIPE